MVQMTGSDEKSRTPHSPDELYGVLSNIRRRYVMYYAKQVGLPVLFDELVEQIAAWESPGGADDVTREHRKSVHNALRQTHLPKLEQAGLINHDPESDIITLTDEAKRVKLYPATETSVWVYGYSLLSIAIIILVGLDVLGILLVTPQTGMPWIEGVFLSIILLTISHNYDRYQRRNRFRNYGPDIIVDETTKNKTTSLPTGQTIER